MITTNTQGIIFPPYLLFGGSDISAVPMDILERRIDVDGNFTPTGWMTEEAFIVWLLKFIQRLNEMRSEKENCLLILDGHSTHISESALYTAALNHVVILIGPSQLTNAWQANDQLTNKTLKKLVKQNITPLLEMGESPSKNDLTLALLKACHNPLMMTAIKKSFKKVGVHPVDRNRINAMIREQNPDENILLDTPGLKAVLTWTEERMSKFDHLLGEKRKHEEDQKSIEKAAKKRKTGRLDTSFAVVASTSDAIAILQKNKAFSEMKKMKVKDLREKMLQMGYTANFLRKENSHCFKTKEDLLAILESSLEEQVSRHKDTIQEELNQKLMQPPPFEPVATVTRRDVETISD